MRAILADQIDPELYHAFMDANFRRSGRVIYQPVCAGCRQCQSLRVDVRAFHPTKSQRRCQRKNADVHVSVAAPLATEQKFLLYQHYQAERHGRPEGDYDEFVDFLYKSPVKSLEFEYRDRFDQLIAVGLCDVSRQSLSSVYFYFDPNEGKRSLGTFGGLYEINWAAERSIPHYYLGYWVPDCPTMRYKADYTPHQLLGTDGEWREQ